MKVVALIVNEPGALELWTLKRLADVAEIRIVRGVSASGTSRWRQLGRLMRDLGPAGVASRLLAGRLIRRRESLREAELLDRLLDGRHLREWWAASGLAPVDVPDLNHPDAGRHIALSEPDLIVRVSGGVLRRATFSLARLATLNIHHGRAPEIRGMFSILWGIVENRREWIGATVHLIDDGVDTGTVLWRGAPQLAPGDTGAHLLFRAHLEAVEALVRIVCNYAEAGQSPPVAGAKQGPSVYRSAPGLAPWLRYLRLGRGRRARVTLERALRC